MSTTKPPPADIAPPASEAVSARSSDLPQRGARLSWSTITAYGAPGMGAGYMYLLLGLYVMKFSTDVLLIAPAAMGLIFGISRIWDGISDPLVGYLSDLTRSRFGRRRIWLLFSMLPIAATFIMVFSPPALLEGPGLTLWMAVAIIGFYSAMTVFMVPHMSLGAELTPDYHERSRLFGLRHAAFTSGSILALVSMFLFISAEAEGPERAREVAANVAWIAALGTMPLIAWALYNVRENPKFEGRVKGSPFQAYRDVWHNKYAKLLLIVIFIENVGSAAIGVLTLYVAQYVVGRPDLAVFMILSYMIPSTFSVPIWLPLSRRFGKVRLWIFSQVLTGLSFGGMFALPFIASEPAMLMLIFTLAALAGLAAGCGGTVGPSVQGDVIDYDEYRTGERKEGSYFAAWTFVNKSATGVMLLLTGFILQASGFVPNQAQTMQVQVAIVSLYGLFPLVCYLTGAYLFSYFKLDEVAHNSIRAELERRRGPA
jgi:glycoside/pentoside/hexuronide:cation symporter, GPH family